VRFRGDDVSVGFWLDDVDEDALAGTSCTLPAFRIGAEKGLAEESLVGVFNNVDFVGVLEPFAPLSFDSLPPPTACLRRKTLAMLSAGTTNGVVRFVCCREVLPAFDNVTGGTAGRFEDEVVTCGSSALLTVNSAIFLI